MPYACIMAGLHVYFSLVVIVGPYLLCSTPFIVPQGDSLQSGTMNTEISQPTYSPKYVAMSWLNLFYKSFPENNCPMPQQICKSKPELTLLLQGFGADIREHSSMQKFLIYLLIPTSILPFPLAANNNGNEGRKAYDQRIREVEQGSFAPDCLLS